jgi:signal transduction histidine kinase
MKIDQLFSTLPFPFRVQTLVPYSLQFESPGLLFDQPNYRNLNDSFWENIDAVGWHTCRAGFAVLVKPLPGDSSRLLVLHGLKVKPFWKQRGGTSGVSIVLDATRVESYVDQFLRELARLATNIDQEIDSRTRALSTENVHEIRSMNTSLYHAGFELQEQLLYDKQKLALAKNVVALSELVSARIELADLATTSLEEHIVQFTAPIPVYKKFDKIVKCYIAYAAKREITITIDGDSRSQTRGIEQFEMIPLIVIDNAVKYSPNKSSIDISIKEHEKYVEVSVTSLGPKIEPHEKNSIFDREVRGVHALKSGQGGSGIGLYFARRLLDSIGAAISIAQESQPVTMGPIQGKSFYLTTFSLKFEKVQQAR